MTNNPLYIFDIDGTLANLAHRLHYIRPEDGLSTVKFKPDWQGFYTDVLWDEPIHQTIRTMEYLSEHAEIWFFTGRDESIREDTVWWISAFTSLTQDINLTMRGHTDTRSDVIVKGEMYDSMLDGDKDRLIAIFEDRRKVTDMWREKGIMCYQVESGEF